MRNKDISREKISQLLSSRSQQQESKLELLALGQMVGPKIIVNTTNLKKKHGMTKSLTAISTLKSVNKLTENLIRKSPEF